MGILGQVLAVILWAGASYGVYVALHRWGVHHGVLAWVVYGVALVASAVAFLLILGHIVVGLLERRLAAVKAQHAVMIDEIIATGKPIEMSEEKYAAFKAGAEAYGPEAMERFRKLAKLAGRG